MVSIPLQGLQPFGQTTLVLLMREPLLLVSIPLQGLQPFGPHATHNKRLCHLRVSIPLQGLEAFGLEWYVEAVEYAAKFQSLFRD